jgi:hypothetical protein
VWYYSTPVQLEELLQAVDKEHMEVALAREIGDFKEEIVRQMEITEKLTNLNKGNKKSYLDAENSELRNIAEVSSHIRNSCWTSSFMPLIHCLLQFVSYVSV